MGTLILDVVGDLRHYKECVMTIEQKTLLIETRLAKAELSTIYIHEEIKEIKRNLRWLTGIIFSLNTTIIGLLAMGFELI